MRLAPFSVTVSGAPRFGISLAQGPRQGRALVVGDRLDHQALAVEHHLFRVRRGGDVEGGRAGHLLAGEVRGQVQVDVRDPGHQGLGVGVDVAGFRRRQDRRDRRRGPLCLDLGQGRHGGSAQQERQQGGAGGGFQGHGEAESIYGEVVFTVLAQLCARSRANHPATIVIPGEAKRRPGDRRKRRAHSSVPDRRAARLSGITGLGEIQLRDSPAGSSRRCSRCRRR